jgi:hypothetical protein
VCRPVSLQHCGSCQGSVPINLAPLGRAPSHRRALCLDADRLLGSLSPTLPLVDGPPPPSQAAGELPGLEHPAQSNTCYHPAAMRCLDALTPSYHCADGQKRRTCIFVIPQHSPAYMPLCAGICTCEYRHI